MYVVVVSLYLFPQLCEEKDDQVNKLQDQLKERDLEIAELKASRKSDRLETKSVDNEKRVSACLHLCNRGNYNH